MKLGKTTRTTKPAAAKSTKVKPPKVAAKSPAKKAPKVAAAVKKTRALAKNASTKGRGIIKSPSEVAANPGKPVEKVESPVVVTAASSIPGPLAAKPRPQRVPRPVPVEIPKILLEPDHAPDAAPIAAGPGARFEQAPAVPAAQQPATLPDSYGTEQIFLAARDPYWALASWDLDERQRASYEAISASGRLTVRLRRDGPEGPIHLEAQPEEGAKDWFIHVGSPNTTFVAELGIFEAKSGAWRRISVSRPVTTPRDRAARPSFVAPLPSAPVSDERFEPSPESPVAKPESTPNRQPIVFATIPEAPRFSEWQMDIPNSAPQPVETPRWTEAQARALDELISLEVKRRQMGSLEIEELLRRAILGARSPELGQGLEAAAPSSLELAGVAELLGLAKPEAPSSIESIPAAEKRKGFWFKVNAELVIYGSTEPDANVSIGGRPIRLRSDGSFSYRFALPDGNYELPVVAVSRDGSDGRSAELRFMRATRYGGEVEAHPQDPALKAPSIGNL